jgi:light-regulated signal transduction histidine kinase (bacteriophytochrome)
VVRGDPTMLAQVMQNLIGNALKFSAGRERPRIEVGMREAGGERLFFVRDNGAGFDMQYADKLFGMFQRLHRESQFAGTGVGLSIVKRLIERHGGRIWAEAAPDRGATFSFTLPGSPA